MKQEENTEEMFAPPKRSLVFLAHRLLQAGAQLGKAEAAQRGPWIRVSGSRDFAGSSNFHNLEVTFTLSLCLSPWQRDAHFHVLTEVVESSSLLKSSHSSTVGSMFAGLCAVAFQT